MATKQGVLEKLAEDPRIVNVKNNWLTRAKLYAAGGGGLADRVGSGAKKSTGVKINTRKPRKVKVAPLPPSTE